MSAFFMSDMNKILEIYNQINQFGNDQGMTFKVIKPGEIEYRMTILEKHLATLEVVHGGVIASFMDGVLGVACLSISAEENKLVATVEFKINYLKPVKLGDILLGKGKVDQVGKSIIIASGSIINEKTKEPVAMGMGTFKTYPVEKTGLHKKF